MVGVVVLAIGDAFSGLIGLRLGKRKVWGKSVEGSLAFFFSTFVVLAPFIGTWKAFLISFISSLVELFSSRLDDNFTVPLTASLLYKILVL